MVVEEAEFLENEQGEGSHCVAQEVFDDHLDEWELRIYKANRTHIQMPRRLEKPRGMWPKALWNTGKSGQGRFGGTSVGNRQLVTEVILRSCFCDVRGRFLIGCHSRV